jgi:hypothetical protein
VPFKIAIVGCGGIATDSHGPALAYYARTHPDTELAACCDLDECKAAAYAKRFGFARHFTDLDELLDAVRPGAVRGTATPAWQNPRPRPPRRGLRWQFGKRFPPTRSARELSKPSAQIEGTRPGFSRISGSVVNRASFSPIFVQV